MPESRLRSAQLPAPDKEWRIGASFDILAAPRFDKRLL